HTEAAAVPPLDALARVHEQYIATGITSVIERAASVDGYKAYENLKRANQLKVRATVTIRVPHPEDAADVERFVSGLPFHFGSGDDWLKVGPLKIFTDGGILIGTAYMREPYGPGAHDLYAIDDPRYRGFLTLTPAQIASAILIGHKHGWQMVAHVTGDAGVDVVLDAFEAAQKELPAPDRRHTLIHAYFVHPETAMRAARLGVLVDTQPAWYYKDADALSTGLGVDRLAHFIGLRTLRQAGVDVAINTDHMFGLDRDQALNPFNPFLTMYAAGTRRVRSRLHEVPPGRARDRGRTIAGAVGGHDHFHADGARRGDHAGRIRHRARVSVEALHPPVDRDPRGPRTRRAGRGARTAV